jgi:hypothetical protein
MGALIFDSAKYINENIAINEYKTPEELKMKIFNESANTSQQTEDEPIGRNGRAI